MIQAIQSNKIIVPNRKYFLTYKLCLFIIGLIIGITLGVIL